MTRMPWRSQNASYCGRGKMVSVSSAQNIGTSVGSSVEDCIVVGIGQDDRGFHKMARRG